MQPLVSCQRERHISTPAITLPECNVDNEHAAVTARRPEALRVPSVAKRDPGQRLPFLFLRELIVAHTQARPSRRSELPWRVLQAGKHIRRSVRLGKEWERGARAHSLAHLHHRSPTWLSGRRCAGGGGEYQYLSLNECVQGRR